MLECMSGGGCKAGGPEDAVAAKLKFVKTRGTAEGIVGLEGGSS